MQFLLVHFLISYNYYFLKAESTKGIHYLLDIIANYSEVYILITNSFPRISDSSTF